MRINIVDSMADMLDGKIRSPCPCQVVCESILWIQWRTCCLAKFAVLVKWFVVVLVSVFVSVLLLLLVLLQQLLLVSLLAIVLPPLPDGGRVWYR
jgi:hypothetical protein